MYTSKADEAEQNGLPPFGLLLYHRPLFIIEYPSMKQKWIDIMN
jgi:hypothetical protein